ncbi:MAG: enolase C-terminal domain-like protein [Pseudomonadota bacterium]
MKIASLHVRAVKVPMPEPHRTASGVIDASPLVLLSLRTDSGLEGHSITFTYTPAALGPVASLMKNMEPLVAGQVLAPIAVSDQLHARFRLLGTQGLVGMALAGIDMAMWDALARSQGQSLYTALGGAARPIRAYAGIGYDGEKESARAAERWAQQGFRGVKAKIGYPTLAEDIAVIRAMRQAAGPDVELMVDYNQSLTAAEAQLRLRALDAEGLAWVEEPVLAHDYAAFVQLAAGAATPLQAGENWWGPLDFRHALNAGVRDHLMPDAMKCGGVTGWIRVAAMAQVYGVPVSSHLWPEVSAQLLAVTPTAHRLEYADWWNPILKSPLQVREGMAIVEGVIGTGVEFDDAAIARFEA